MTGRFGSVRARVAGTTLLVLAVAAALLVALWPSESARPAPAHTRTTTPVAAPPPPTPTISPVAKREPPAPALAPVAASAPTGFILAGPGFTIDANVCGMDYVRPLDPPGDQLHTVCWVQRDFGVAPSYPSHGTTYVLGHAWAEQKLVLNPMSELAMNQVAPSYPGHPSYEHGVPIYPITVLNGYRLVLQTGTGTLTYRVTRAFAVAKNDAGNVPSVMAANTPNRVVLITCGVHDGVDVDVNVIAYATLIGAKGR